MKALEKEWNQLLRKEEKWLREPKRNALTEPVQKMRDLEADAKSKIPPKVLVSLEKGFEQGLLLMFTKGSVVVEKTIAKEEMQVEFEVDDLRVNRLQNKKSIRKITKKSGKTNLRNGCITTIEGVGLGAFGIGLPDIPVFLGVILKGIYETALSYGFVYDTEWEQVYILKVIRCALVSGGEKRMLHQEIETFVSNSQNTTYSYADEMGKTANALAEAMLLGKFVQGVFVIGALGGLVNPVIYNRILQYATLQYKKRYLIGKLSCV
ncbi:EcsC family protein [Chakrabartyella piscis]|uniref:EcsC family protein n=1 Tax=Chakrabartyella piscis TaxID=2918914 RepID=UPI002958B3A1|nr:EcsC family protein [Chakrabartyella piscis]